MYVVHHTNTRRNHNIHIPYLNQLNWTKSNIFKSIQTKRYYTNANTKRNSQRIYQGKYMSGNIRQPFYIQTDFCATFICDRIKALPVSYYWFASFYSSRIIHQPNNSRQWRIPTVELRTYKCSTEQLENIYIVLIHIHIYGSIYIIWICIVGLNIHSKRLNVDDIKIL